MNDEILMTWKFPMTNALRQERKRQNGSGPSATPMKFTIYDLRFTIGGKRLSAAFPDACRLGVRRPAEGDAALGMALGFGPQERFGCRPQFESGVTATALQDASECEKAALNPSLNHKSPMAFTPASQPAARPNCGQPADLEIRDTADLEVCATRSRIDQSPILNHKSLIINHKSPSAFTLIELLTVIAVIGVLAALLLPVAGAVKRREYINTATAEMQKIETAMERYKAQYGFYPPGGTSVLENPLYAELVGTTNVGTAGVLVFNSLDGNMQGMNPNAFGMSGFVNCSKPGAGGETSQAATDFIGELKTTQIAAVTNINNTAGTNALLTVSVGGPDASYKPVGIQGVNPWRYAYPGTNNPSSYDLWVQLVISGKSNLVCNWSDKVQINAPYP